MTDPEKADIDWAFRTIKELRKQKLELQGYTSLTFDDFKAIAAATATEEHIRGYLQRFESKEALAYIMIEKLKL